MSSSPLNKTNSQALSHNLFTSSTTTINSGGDSKSLCLRPLEVLEKKDGPPFTIFAKDAILIQELIHLDHLSPKPNLFNI